ncbi:histidine kinase [Bacteroides caecigallinarum]|uniref:tetratricopeptide repeat-containing sensor histidine kinase n=1 Tax=Bacteroides caecigallinarum TaxID=1411144 RepID=UPI00195E033B|nr:histidine kinase [Bacteroides caecigallinarum]MBM6863805.1 histidine kinase [Bacteroides caecigallinarum]
MHKSFYFILYLIIAPIVYSGCVSRTNERHDYDGNDSLIGHLESLIGTNPNRVVKEVDSLYYDSDVSLSYKLLLIKSKAMLFLSQYDSVKILLDSIQKFYSTPIPGKEIDYDMLSRVNNMYGNFYSRRAIMDSAIVRFRRAYKYSSGLGLSNNLVDISINLADAYVRRGQFDMGAYWYRKSLLLSDSLMIPEEKRFPSYYGLAQVYMELRDYQQCDYFYDLAGRFYDNMMPFEKHIYLNNRGNSYYFRGDYKQALEYFRKIMRLTASYKDMDFERYLTKVNLGEVFLLMNETDSATYYLEDCYSFFKSINHVSALYYIETQLIELALKKGDVHLASEIISKAVKPEFIEPNMLHIRNKYLQHYFEQSGDYKNAYYYQRNNAFIDDSIRNERIKMRSAEIALKYRQDSTLMKKELFIKEKENEVLQLNQWIYILFLSLLFIVSLSIILTIYRKRRSDKKIWGMQADISSLRLENVRNRISPHFIFNVLNREVARYTDDVDKNNLVALSKLIRKNLELTGNLSISLCDELDFVKTYVSIQMQTMGEGFSYEISVDEGIECKEILIPSMLIQIPVENALKHALKTKEGKKRLWIKVFKDDKRIYITVTDNGGGFKKVSSNRGTGTGLKVITQSIQLLNLYNKEPITMKISNVKLDEEETGCEISYSIPVGYSYKIVK